MRCYITTVSPPAGQPKWSLAGALHHKFHTHAGVGCDARPLDDIKFGPPFTFPAVAVDNCTRAPVEPAVEVCPDLNLQN